MSNLASLTAQREGLLKKIRAIEASCEGIENENNAKRVQKLNLEPSTVLCAKAGNSCEISSIRWEFSKYKCRDIRIIRNGFRKNS